MDLADRLKELSSRIPSQLGHIATEEATKTSLVLPFIQALGYNVFDPREVTPELVADVGVKKGEKVDYAILADGKPIMLFECKASSADLDVVHASQLYRYFSVTDARIGILTNGVVYRFFSDLEAENKMDSKPFLEVDMLALDDFAILELKKFAKSTFDTESILANASELKYTRELKRVLAAELAQPTEPFVKFLAAQVYDGRLTHSVVEMFSGIVRRALQQFISDRVSDRLKAALESTEAATPAPPPPAETAPHDEAETTAEELQASFIVQAILAESVDPKRIVIRDQKSYCAVLLDDNNRKPICRLWFNTGQKYLGLFDAEKKETRHAIEQLRDIYRFAASLREAGARYA